MVKGLRTCRARPYVTIITLNNVHYVFLSPIYHPSRIPHRDQNLEARRADRSRMLINVNCC